MELQEKIEFYTNLYEKVQEENEKLKKGILVLENKLKDSNYNYLELCKKREEEKLEFETKMENANSAYLRKMEETDIKFEACKLSWEEKVDFFLI